MRRRTREFPGGWSVPTCLAWLICVLVVAWLSGRQDNLGTGPFVLLLVASVLGLALGVALVRERRSGRIFVAVPTVALLATFTTALAYNSLPVSDQYSGEGPYWDLWVIVVVVVLGAPVFVGAFAGAVWRLASTRLVARMTTGEATSPGRERGG